jgi:hypothetical protein
MKQISLIIFLGLALSFCNLTNKLKPGNTKTPSNAPATASSQPSGSGDPVEQPNPTTAQTTALEGGQEVKWDQQGISFTVPPKWIEATNETKMLVWRSPGSWEGASLIVNISALADSFPTEMSLNGFYQNARTRAKNGEVDEVKWLALDGVRGLQFREANPEEPDDQRRLQWLGYRKYAGQVQLVNLLLAAPGKDFARHQDAIYGILYSTKMAH